MATQQKIDNLKKVCDQWRDYLKNAVKRREELLFWQSQDLYIYENDGENLLPTLIAEADSAALQCQSILIKMESLRDRAIAGEDV